MRAGRLEEKTVILVTNQVHWLKECSVSIRAKLSFWATLADERGGHILHIGTFDELQKKGCNLLEVVGDGLDSNKIERLGLS